MSPDAKTYMVGKSLFPDQWDDPVIKAIIESVSESSYEAAQNAAYSGSWDDGGASAYIEKLKVWLDGVTYAKTGKTTRYKSITKKLEREANPDYAEYQRLKQIFEE